MDVLPVDSHSKKSEFAKVLYAGSVVLLCIWVLVVFPVICAMSVDYTSKVIQFVLAIPFSFMAHIFAWWCCSQVIENASACIRQLCK